MAREELNPDALAAEREAQPIVIGGKTFHQVKRTNKRMRQVRKLIREANQKTRAAELQLAPLKVQLEQAQADKLDAKAEALALEMAPLQDELEEAQDDQLLFKQIALLLVDEEGKPATVAHLEEHLDMVDAIALSAWLNDTGGDKPGAASDGDPTSS